METTGIVSSVTMIALPCDSDDVSATFEERERGYRWHHYALKNRPGFKHEVHEDIVRASRILRMSNGVLKMEDVVPEYKVEYKVEYNGKVLADYDPRLKTTQNRWIPKAAEFMEYTTTMYLLTDLAVMLRRSPMDEKTKDILVSLIAMSPLFDKVNGFINARVVKTPHDFITVVKTPYPEDHLQAFREFSSHTHAIK
jgi:hypothetical protein